MARTRINAKKITREYARTLSSVIRIDGMALFGSAARGVMTAESDIDLIVLSRDFAHTPIMRRLELLNRMRRGSALRVPMDIIGFTPQEFTALKRSESPNLRRVYREARMVYP